MKKIFVFLVLLACSFSAYTANCVSTPLSCPPLNLQQTPILLNPSDSADAPNIMFLLDNSSTMGAPGGAKAQAAKNAYKWILDSYPNFRYGLEYQSAAEDDYTRTTLTSKFKPIPALGANLATHNATLKTTIDSWQEFGGTPMYLATIRIAKYLQGRMPLHPSPVISKCQKNYLVIVTDGQWKNKDPTRTIQDYAKNYAVEKSDPAVSTGDIDRDGDNKQFADLIRYFYVNKLNTAVQGPDIPNRYTANLEDPSFENNLRLFFVHLLTDRQATEVVTFPLGSDGWPNPHRAANFAWGGATGGAPSGFVGMWHAAWNSNGAYARITDHNTPNFENSLKGVLDSFFQTISVISYSGSPVAQNSSVLSTGSAIYQSYFTSLGWTGDVLAYGISDAQGISSAPMWSASCKLNGGACTNPVGVNTGKTATNRVIITRDWLSNKGIAFRWPTDYTTKSRTTYAPSKNISNFLANAPHPVTTTTSTQITANNTYAQNLLNYIRGDATKEIKNGGTFRNRTSMLGDIIDSSPVYVGKPDGAFNDTSEVMKYSDFKTANTNRTPVVYVGANDGMLHGFNANTGDEVLAYVPGDNEIYKKLPQLSMNPYNHAFFSNATPVVSDAFFKGQWRTILASALGNGGKSIYALNITNPASFAETNASNIYLFEFSNADDQDVGFIHGSPSIVKVRKDASSHQWAIIFGNGYNSSTATTGTGKAALYILLIDPALSGPNVSWVLNTSFIKIPVGVGDRNNPNGLSSPYAFDKDGDGVIDYVYAGDLQGNIWRFDLTSNSPASWTSSASLLFTARQTANGDQPITARPVVGPHPDGIEKGVMVYFGTGKFLEPGDNSTTGQTTQTFYGIWDNLLTISPSTAIVSKTALLQQTILGSMSNPQGSFRLVSNNQMDWKTKSGWYIDLRDASLSSNNGERQVSVPFLRNDRVIFTTLIPPMKSNLTTNCNSPVMGDSWLMELNMETGGSPMVTFDTNGDGIFDKNDVIQVGSYIGEAAGYKSIVGIAGSPTIFVVPNASYERKVLSGSGLDLVKENAAAPREPSGRRESWKQIFY